MTSSPDTVLRRVRDLGIAEWSDQRLAAYVADRVRVPRREPADSFVLHAPLELIARLALLPRVAVRARPRARLRLLTLLERYESKEPATFAERTLPRDGAEAARLLVRALDENDLDAADAAARALARLADATEIAARIGGPALASLAAAGHAPIFLAQYPRLAPRADVTAELLRPLARELARNGDLRLQWVQRRAGGAPTGSAGALEDVLGAVPSLGVPGSTFIHPLMHQVDVDMAPRLLGPATAGLRVAAAAPVLLRAAARAMLVEDPSHAPYGWSHCLTMPQGALMVGTAHPELAQLAVDVAATHVVGFLAAEARAPLPPTVAFEHPRSPTFAAARADSRASAAAWAWHAGPDACAATWQELVSEAATRHDAHLVKYTLACLDAAAMDPDAVNLYLAAAASLLAHWEASGDPDDPLRGVGDAGA